jgi:hypothetical protein
VLVHACVSRILATPEYATLGRAHPRLKILAGIKGYLKHLYNK